MTAREGERLALEGPITFDTVPGLVAAIETGPGDGTCVIDFAGVTEVDSSAVALVIEWHRRAERRKLTLRLANLPSSMKNLADLYGVSDLLQPAAG